MLPVERQTHLPVDAAKELRTSSYFINNHSKNEAKSIGHGGSGPSCFIAHLAIYKLLLTTHGAHMTIMKQTWSASLEGGQQVIKLIRGNGVQGKEAAVWVAAGTALGSQIATICH